LARSAINTGTDEPTRQRDLRVLRPLLGYLRPYRLAIVGALIALIIAAGTVMTMGQGLRLLIDRGFRTELLDQALLVFLVVIFVLALASYSRFFLVSWIGERVVADIRRAIFQHIIKLSPGFFEVTPTGEVLSRLTTDTTLLQVIIGSSVSIALRNTLLFVGCSIMLAVTNPRLTGFVFLFVPLVIVPIIFFGRRVRRFSRASQDRLADVGAFGTETLSSVRTMQAFTHEAIDRERFTGHVENAFATAIDRVRARAFLTAIVIMFVFGAVGAILWLGGKDVIANRITAGELSAFVFYAVIVAGSIGAISEVFGDLQRAAGATERLLELLSTKPDIAAPESPISLPDPPNGQLSFEQVTFAYPSRPDTPALVGFDLDVKPGETIAIVGPSGAGKSTVFQLLLRFYDPQSGRVTVDDVEIRDVDPAQLRFRFGLVPQDPVIFSADAAENIRYGRPDANATDVRAAAEAAAATEFIDRLPDGIHTHLGEKGVRLSGGQRQRIAIARAILRNPTFLLLDEATSALDAESEQLVQQALERLMANRTTIVIAHRLATVLAADRIVVMDRGEVIAKGTHTQLIKRGGLYARLAELQFNQGQMLGAGADADVNAEVI
jgi:ATP-binding cassette subfamily B protein